MNTRILKALRVVGMLCAFLGGAGAQAQASPPVTWASQRLVAITSPRSGATVNDLRVIAGTAQGTAAGARQVLGIAIAISIRRTRDGARWNGSAWSQTLSLLPALLSRGAQASTWRLLNGPGFSALNDGSYEIVARATLSRGMAGARAVVGADVSGPKLSIDTPNVDFSRLFPSLPVVLAPEALQVLAGNAVDRSGTSRLLLGIRRESDATMWNGSAWVRALAYREAGLSGSVLTRRWQVVLAPMEPRSSLRQTVALSASS